MNPLSSNHSGPNRVAMISGYRGLAETLIDTFHQAGYQLSVLVRKPEVISSLKDRFPNAFFAVGDLRSKEVCEEWVHRTRSTLGEIDCLINNAALPGPAGRLGDFDFKEYCETIDVNLLAPTYLMHLVLPHFAKRGQGVIVNLSGGGATYPRPRASAYAVSKCALVRLTETVATEYPQLGIYALSPGPLMTPMIEAILKMDPEMVGEKDYEEAKRRSQQGGEDPQKAANLALWLCEQQPENLRGKIISAIWDDYKNLPGHADETHWWTLRRVDEVCAKNLKSGL